MTHANRSIATFTAAYSIFFIVYALLHRNYEFIFYSAIILILLTVVINIGQRIVLDGWIALTLSLFGLLHLVAGNLTWQGRRLYDLGYFQGLIHFDNIVHSIGTFLITLILYNLTYRFIDTRIQERYLVLYLLIFLMSLGIGSVGEAIEFVAVACLDAGVTVGDYFNNALDILFNMVGTVLAIVVIHLYLRRHMHIKL